MVADGADMKIYRNMKVPTGNILIVEGEKGRLECLSIGDYGKDHNLKADFMGLTREINGVDHRDLLHLEEKWVITISSQYGCSSDCAFCDVPKVGPGINATLADLIGQVQTAMSIHPEVMWSNRLNLHYARMGEPTWNPAVLESAKILYGNKESKFNLHAVVSTMMPRKNKKLMSFLSSWLAIKDEANGEAGLQISINTTDDHARAVTMPEAMTLREISDMFFDILAYREIPKGRKITLNFALTDDEINAELLRNLFSPRYFLCKITPMHKTKSADCNGLVTIDGYSKYYPYKEAEEALKAQGFDVIVFIPSKEEDESRITCGNAILSDKKYCQAA